MTKNMPRIGHWSRRMGRAFNIVIDSFLADGAVDIVFADRRATFPTDEAWIDTQR